MTKEFVQYTVHLRMGESTHPTKDHKLRDVQLDVIWPFDHHLNPSHAVTVCDNTRVITAIN